MPTDDLAEHLTQLINGMRAESRLSVLAFLRSADEGMGGVLSIQAPSALRKRTRPEAGYRSEQFSDITR